MKKDGLEEELRNAKLELQALNSALTQRDCTISDLNNDFNSKMNMFRTLAAENEKHQIFLTHLMKNSVDFLIMVDDKLSIAYCSDSFFHKIGTDPFKTTEGKNILDVYSWFADSDLFSELASMLAIAVGQDKTSRHDVFADIAKCGENRVYRVTNTPMNDKSVNGVIINWNDITDNHKRKN